MKRLFPLAVLVLSVMLTQARAEGPDEQYVRIYNLIQQADSLSNSDQPAAALAKYLEAQTALQDFQKLYPDWQVKVVNFRLSYLASKIATIASKVPTPAAPTPGTLPASVKPETPAAPASPETPAELDRRMSSLQDEVRRLQADKIVLETKLKESLATQPASADPRELTKAQEKIRTLLRENDLLKASMAQEAAKPPAGVDPKAYEETRQALAEANRKLAEQSERANALAVEKKVLQGRLDSLTPSAANISKIEMTQKALDDANRKLAEQSDSAGKLTRDKEELLARIKTLTAGVEAADALRAENQLLKQQVAEFKSAASSSTNQSDTLNRQLVQAQARIAVMQSDAEILRLERMALENRVKSLMARAVASAASSAASRPRDLERIKLLEAERDDLAKKLNIANKALSDRGSRTTAARVDELQGQVSALRSRLAVYEARAIPYSADELALFKAPEPQLAKTDPKAVKKPASAMPAGTATLMTEAQRLFQARKYDEAEDKYLQALRQGENNAYTLANLAAIQIELGHLDQAETHVKEALTAAPDDAYSLSILGYLRFKQERYDDALDALSRSARLNPQSAEVQNYLGVTLSHKGLRSQAETALRKAIQLDPNYGSAHNNLAVIYATQQPPMIQLARWHYEKALGTGHPRNAELEKLFAEKGAPVNAP